MSEGSDKGPSKRPPTEPSKRIEGDAATTAPTDFYWIEAKYRREDFTTFTARFYVPKTESCPGTAKDKTGNSGTLVEGTCIEVNQGCFIATAAFGSELHPQVQLLRQFRDERLLKSDLGAAFERVLSTYYRFSPPVAAAMKRNNGARTIIKVTSVYPAIIFAKGWVALLKAIHKDLSHNPDKLDGKKPSEITPDAGQTFSDRFAE